MSLAPCRKLLRAQTTMKVRSIFDNVLTNIESLAKDDNYGYRKADPYWARVLWQTEQFKSQDGLLQLVKQTTSWFGEMLS